MPILAMFFGIVIRMNWKEVGQHNKPHFHAIYGSAKATFTLDGELLVGDFPNKQSAYVKAWALLHEDELRANWDLAVNGEETFRIDPLK